MMKFLDTNLENLLENVQFISAPEKELRYKP